MAGFKEEHGPKNLFLALPDSVLLELNRLQNQLKEKVKELQDAFTEIKVLKASEVVKDKAIEELRNGVHKLDEKLVFNESIVEQKTLEAKKLTSEKKEALAAQFSAEASLRRLYENQKDEDAVPILSIIAPLEADIKMYKVEIAALLEDKKALERLSKSKEAALVEAERILKSALERALVVEEVQNQNSELKRQIEIYQEENKILDKTNRQKVLEVQRLTQTIRELEEAVLAGGAAANTIRDCQRQISELHEEKRTLERELARAKVSANRVATVVANKWKDENDKVMPVKQCLEERRLLQAELQRLRDKLAVSERTAKVEAQLKDKLKLRLRALELGLRRVSSISVYPSASSSGSTWMEPVNRMSSFLPSSGGLKKRCRSQPRDSTTDRSSPLQLQHHNTENGTANAGGESKHADMLNIKHVSGEYMQGKYPAVSNGKENTGMKTNRVENIDTADAADVSKAKGGGGSKGSANSDTEDAVSGFLYDRLQREVLNLRKVCEVQDNNLIAKDEEIKTLMKKMDTLTKSIQVESKKTRRQAAGRGKEVVSAKADGESRRTRNTSNASKVCLH